MKSGKLEDHIGESISVLLSLFEITLSVFFLVQWNFWFACTIFTEH